MMENIGPSVSGSLLARANHLEMSDRSTLGLQVIIAAARGVHPLDRTLPPPTSSEKDLHFQKT